MFLAVSFFCVIFQSSFLVHFPIFGWVINLSLILAVWFLIFWNFKRGLVFAFFSGLFLDFFSAEPFGLNLGSFVFCLIFINFFQKFTKFKKLSKFFVFFPLALIIYEALAKFLSWATLMIIK